MNDERVYETEAGLAEASTGNTIEQAEAQHPGLDTSLPPASERTPEGDELVLAQSPEEVEAQYVNAAGGGEGIRTEEGDANEENPGEEFSEDEAAAYEAEADADATAAPAPASPPARGRPADGDTADAPEADSDSIVTDAIEADDTADGGDVTGR